MKRIITLIFIWMACSGGIFSRQMSWGTSSQDLVTMLKEYEQGLEL